MLDQRLTAGELRGMSATTGDIQPLKARLPDTVAPDAPVRILQKYGRTGTYFEQRA